MGAWRFGKPWKPAEIAQALASYKRAAFNYPLIEEGGAPKKGWLHLCTEAMVAKEDPASVGPAFEAAWSCVSSYRFSDPRIVEGHFDEPLEKRTVCQELKVFGFSFLCGVRVTAVKEISAQNQFQRGFRYDTLEGHLECGAEWFLLTKNLTTGEIYFRIATVNGPGIFPSWWVRCGFLLFAKWYRRLWHRQAFRRIRLAISEAKVNAPSLSPSQKQIRALGPECKAGFLEA